MFKTHIFFCVGLTQQQHTFSLLAYKDWQTFGTDSHGECEDFSFPLCLVFYSFVVKLLHKCSFLLPLFSDLEVAFSNFETLVRSDWF